MKEVRKRLPSNSVASSPSHPSILNAKWRGGSLKLYNVEAGSRPPRLPSLSLTANLLNSGLKIGKGLPPKIASAKNDQMISMFKAAILFLNILPFLDADTMSLDVYTQNIPLTQKATVNFVRNYQRKYRKDRTAKRLQRKED